MSAEEKKPQDGPRFSFNPKTGEWHCYDLRGLREEAKQKIAGSELPERAKAYLIAKIDLLPVECLAVRVDAYEITNSKPHEVALVTNSAVVGIKL
jgi:hypothetical protein